MTTRIVNGTPEYLYEFIMNDGTIAVSWGINRFDAAKRLRENM